MTHLNQSAFESFPIPPGEGKPRVGTTALKWALIALFSLSLSALWIRSFNQTLTQPFTLLLLGSDQRDKGDPSRSDSIFLLRLDPHQHTARGLVLPRDLYTTIQSLPVRRTAKLNAALFYGDYYQANGIKAAEETIKDLVGVPIDGTVVVHVRLVEHLVDSVGGVEVCLERPAFDSTFSDIDGKPAPVRFESGWNYLDGKRAARFIRVRKPDFDFGRMQRNRLLVDAFLQKIRSPIGIIGALRALPFAWMDIDTDIRPMQAVRMFSAIRLMKNIEWMSIDRADLTSQTIATGAQILVAEPAVMKEAGTKLLGVPDHFASVALPAASPIGTTQR